MTILHRSGTFDAVLLHQVSIADDRALLLPTDAARLSAASFLDGRTDFATGDPITMPLARLLDNLLVSVEPDRYIFHMGFCGSTLLARLVEGSGCDGALVLREPNCFADLANQRAAADRDERPLPEFQAVLDGIRRHLRRRWPDSGPIVIKPSNWANNLLPHIASGGDRLLPVYLSISRNAFLRAVFRGGSDRIAFAARAALHLSSDGREAAAIVSAALDPIAKDDERLARLTLVLHELQERAFAYAEMQGDGQRRRLDHAELTADPAGVARRAADLLEVELSAGQLQANVDRWRGRHAKAPDGLYSAEDEAEADAAVLAHHGQALEAALAWAEAALGPDRT